ncbi:MAG TPA: RHS repeat-associated core domain-containing protein [Blastocatellia bacterium]|nr:RHS repeat-associated core domain-containing protein [Blastocatellia bacterium]
MLSPRILAVLRLFYASFGSFFRVRRLSRAARQVVVAGLILTLIGNQALAGPAPLVVAGVLTDLRQEAHFGWHSSGWAATFNRWFPDRSPNPTPKGWDGKGAPRRERPAPETPERREDRERRIARVQIYPGDVRIETGQQVVFNAIAYDRNGASIGGLVYQWTGWDEERKAPVKVSPTASFSSAVPGRFRLTAEVAGHRAQVTVTVTGIDRTRMLAGQSIETISSAELMKKQIAPGHLPARAAVGQGDSKTAGLLTGKKVDPTARSARRTRASASPLSIMPALQGDYDKTWNASNIGAATSPGLERGEVPGRALGTGMGSGNFQFDAPLLKLDGRGIDLDLAFHYNSRVWTKIGSQVYFDIDKDLIPGWTLGFGKIIVAGSQYMLVDGDGTRHAAAGTARANFPAPASSLQTFEANTVDGTFINYYAEGYQPQFSGGFILKAWARYPNGTTVDYGASELGAGKTGAIYPVKITDANGNYLSITYRGNQGPQIETIIDTLGRSMQFYYDSNNLLTAVTAPGLRDADGNSQPRVLVRLAYDTKNLAANGITYGFQPVVANAIVRNAVIPVVRAIYYPATGTGYWFGDADSYSPYGMIRKVGERRGMTCAAGGGDCAGTGALTQQPTIGAGSMSQEQTYSHPTSPGYSYPHISGLLTEPPTFISRTDNWAARDTSSAPVTSYAMVDNGTTRTMTITRPDGVRSQQISNDDPNSVYYGMVTEDATYPDASSTTPLSRSTTTWEIGDYGSARPLRTDAYDERGQQTYTTYTYGIYNQVTEIRQFGYGNNLLKRVHNEYENGEAYRGSLINSGTLWWHDGGSLFGGPQWSGPHLFNLLKVTETYASNDLTREARTEQQYDQNPPLQDTPGVTQHDSAPDQRGNLTSIKQYANAATLDSNTAITETRYYDVCGNAIKLVTDCCDQTTLQFTSTTQYTYPDSTTRGSATEASKQNVTSAVYDFNTGLVKESTDANGRTSSTVYQVNSLRPEYEYAPTDAYNYHLYDDANLVVYDFVYEAGKSDPDFAARSDKYLDGVGRVHGEIAYGKDYVLDIVDTKFDNLGRLWQQTRPYRSGDTLQWTTFDYDKLDRPTKVTTPDGSVVERFYNESSYPSAATQGVAGQTIRIKDPWNQERWVRFDDQNRLVEVVEPDPNGTGAVASNGLKTNYSYNTLGNLILVNQGSQTRSFRYDSLSRLTHQKLAEQDATLNDSGLYVGATGQWSGVFTYDTRSNLTQKIDARGVKTYFVYNNDPLDRLQAVQYDKSGAPSSLIGNIPDAPNVSYDYLTTGDKTRVENVNVDFGMGNQTLSYDSEGRLNQVRQTFTGRESYPLVTDFLYDSLDRQVDLTYPQPWGTTGERNVAHQTYDLASRLESLSYDENNFVSEPVYNAESQTTSLKIGSLINETAVFDPKTGLLTNQQVKRGTETLVNLNYNYTLNNDASNNGAKTGQLTGITDLKNQVRTRAFVYDHLGRLKQVKGGTNAFSGPDWSQSYVYDRFGNRTSVTKTGSTLNIPLDGLASLAYNTGNNRITSASFEYDPDGNQVRAVVDASGAQQQYRYDAAGRLAQVFDGSGNLLATYSYGASNQRLMSTEGGVTTYYCAASGRLIAEYDAVGANALQWRANYVYLGGRLVATTSASGAQLHHAGRVGTRMTTERATGDVITELLSLPFGILQPFAGTLYGDNSWQHSTKSNPSRQRFTSYDRSATTNLDYAVNRFYSNQQGRFTQVDPIGASAVDGSDPQTLNLYAYCGNDPINRLDPDGLLFGFIKKLFRSVIKVAKVVALAVTAAYAVLTLNVPLLARASIGLLSEIGPRSIRKIAGFAGGVLGVLSGGGLRSFKTPGTFPTGTGVGGVNSFAQSDGGDSQSIAGAFITSFLGAFPQGSQDLKDLRDAKEFEKTPDCFIARKSCESKCSGQFFSGAANTVTAMGAVMLGAGQPIIPKTVVLGGASARTSTASTLFDRMFPNAKFPRSMFPRGVPAPTSNNPMARTRNVSTFLGRATPYVGGFMAAGGIMFGGTLAFSRCVDACVQAGGKCK